MKRLLRWLARVLARGERLLTGGSLMPRGRIKVEIFRPGVGVIFAHEGPNGITDVGLNHILETEFNGGTPVTSWYTGLVNNSGFSAFAAGDTMASHAGWTEFTSYSESDRQEWGAGTASSRQITNASPATFNISSSGTLKGVFITSDDTKSGTTGTLWATAAFSSNVSVVNGDQVKVTYTVSG